MLPSPMEGESTAPHLESGHRATSWAKMLSKRSFHVLSAAERQALWHQARRRGECMRCFHASIQRAAEHEVSGKGASVEESEKGSPKANLVENVQARPGPPGSFDSASPHQPSKPPSDRPRHQRSAMVSEAVQMIQRDHPSPTFADANPNAQTRQNPPTAQTTNPAGSAMGENDPITREGPTGQGIGKAVATDEDVPDTSGLARGARSGAEGVEEPAAGGTAVMGTPGQGRQTAPLIEENEAATEEDAFDLDSAVHTRRRTPAKAEAFEPSTQLTKDDLLHAGHQTTTPATKNHHSTILDHLRQVAHPGEQPGAERTPQQLAEKLMAGQLVHFHSAAEKSATEELARNVAGGRARRYSAQKKLSAGEVQPEVKKYHFAPVSEALRKGMVDRLARGVYDPEGLLKEGGVQRYKNQPLLNELARQAVMNGTYTPKDSERFLRKVQGLLPRAAPAGKPQQQQRKAA